jgi:transposase InsO family protein
MYRMLGQNGELRERRKQRRHPAYQKPELLAERANTVWCWDITKLMGRSKWRYFYLYVILDIFSRRVVGWCVADAETATLFRPLFDDAIAKHNVPPGQLTLHADRGGPMKANATALLLADPRVKPEDKPRRHPLAQPPAHLQRQPVLRKPLQDPEVSAAVPPALRLHRARPQLLPPVL